MKNIAAFILAGGRGERMGVLCEARPKPALPFAGKYRVIDFGLSNCIYSGLNNIAVLTDYRRAYLADYITRWRQENAKHANLHVLEPRNGSYAGTADAVFQNLGAVAKNRADAVLILAADHVYNLDYREMLAFHRMSEADVTVGAVTVPPAQARRFGTVNVSADGRVMGFYEKSAESWSNTASMGIYIFNRKALEDLLTADAANPSSCHDFGYSILPEAVKTRRVFAYKFNGFWRDIGTLNTYFETNMELLRARPEISLDGECPVLTQSQLLSPACISKQAGIVNSVVGPGCVIRGRVENSVLSPRVWVDEGAVVRDSVIMGNVFIGRDSIVDGAILDEWVKVGVHSYIGLGHTGSAIDDNITVLGQGVTIPSNTIIEHKQQVREPVPMETTAKTVMAGAMFSGSLEPRAPDKEISIVEM